MAIMKCEKCGRTYDTDTTGGAESANPAGCFVGDGSQWTDPDCNHCHVCTYDDCEVFLRHGRWVCRDCGP
jgi:hypothetical protein